MENREKRVIPVYCSGKIGHMHFWSLVGKKRKNEVGAILENMVA